MMWTDPIVDEIHAIRTQIAAEHGGDLRKIASRAREVQQQYASRIVSFPPRRPAGWQPPQALAQTQA